MSQFQYKNPIVNSQVTGADSVENRQTYNATNFSVYNVGGYMEVWNLSDLEYTFSGQTGFVELSANTIPVKFNKASTSTLPDSIELYNDGISSGRRRLGMLVYVHENNTTYQFQIDANNSADSYENMWSAATAVSNLVDPTAESITVKNRTGFFQPITQAGQDLIDAWTGSTIEGYNGTSRNDAKWRIFWGTDWQVTGGTIDYNSTGDLSLSSNSGNTVTISGLTKITGGTYYSGTSTIQLVDNLGGTVDITGVTGGVDISVSANTGLGISGPSTLFTIYNTTLSPTLEMDTDVGGIVAGTTVADLTGQTFVDLFNDLLFPTVLPTYTNPTITLNGSPNSQTVEVGDTVSVNFTGKGVKNDAGNFTVIRARKNGSVVQTDNSPTANTETNVPDQFSFSNPNNPNSGFTSTSYTETLTVPAPTGGGTSTSTIYDVNGDYEAGSAKNDNKGNVDTRSAAVRNVNRPQAASTGYDSSNRTITGIYPYFWGVSTTQPTATSVANEISGGTANKVLSSANGTLTITFNANSEFLWFAHFTNYTNKTTWYVDALNSGSIGGGTNLFNTPITTSVSSPDIYWSGINFEIYLGNYQTSTTGSMELRNT